ncbi:MAG: YlxM family DNA-binding protein [Lachnospiraceae bacterium]|nr:YlxM family DNA-binding protein [Lachnospiraceae bacterium]
MEENVRLAYLYDFYAELLNAGQRELFSTFVFQDLSLQEMADELGISRQAVHDRIHRCIHAMEEYEAKLHLLEKYQKIEGLVKEIKTEIDKINGFWKEASAPKGREAEWTKQEEPSVSLENKKKIEELLQEITEVL